MDILRALLMRISRISPLRLVLLVLSATFVAKNIFYSGDKIFQGSRVLTPEEQALVDEQSVKNRERFISGLQFSGIILCAYLFMRYINDKQENSDKERLNQRDHPHSGNQEEEQEEKEEIYVNLDDVNEEKKENSGAKQRKKAKKGKGQKSD